MAAPRASGSHAAVVRRPARLPTARWRAAAVMATLLTASGASAQTTSTYAAVAAAVQQQGNALAAALLHEDYATVAATMCSPVLARVGGAEALARQIEVSFKIMQLQGRQLTQMQFGAASAIVDGAETRFALVPYRSVVRVRDGRVSIESYYLGVQNKGADGWCFIDTAALTPASLRDLFPGAPPALQLPPPAHAIVERDAD